MAWLSSGDWSMWHANYCTVSCIAHLKIVSQKRKPSQMGSLAVWQSGKIFLNHKHIFSEKNEVVFYPLTQWRNGAKKSGVLGNN
jgi:hypothetical protein